MRRFEPTRRNRNIGTAKRGRGKNNRLSIPIRGDHLFWERIDRAVEVQRVIGNRVLRFFVQSTTGDCLHSCTVDDLVKMFSYLPADDWEEVGAVVLRQPRRKERLLAPVWGRLAYAADLAGVGGRVVYSGPAIILEAVNPSVPMKFGRSIGSEEMDELDRLMADGHVVRHGRIHEVYSTLQACRATQLYRTLLHELGHWVDFLEKVERPSLQSPGQYEILLNRYHNRATREKERVAHDYAGRVLQTLSETGAVPFDRILIPERLQKDGLRIEDFSAPAHA